MSPSCGIVHARFPAALSRAWYLDVPTAHWLGTGPGEWWARGLLHAGGRWLVRAIAALMVVAWLLSFACARARAWRWPAGFAALAIVLPTALIGGLKAITNVDCPWDLAGFGGHNPYITLLGDRPDELARPDAFPVRTRALVSR